MTRTHQRRLVLSIGLFLLTVALVVAAVVFLNPTHALAADTAEGFVVKNAQVKQYQSGSVNGGSIRFVVDVPGDLYTQCDPEGGWTYGTIILPAHMLGNSELTLETSSILNIETDKWQESGSSEYHTYTAVLKGQNNSDVIAESFYNTPFAARGYVTNGETVIYSETTLSRSIGYVATMNVAVGNDTSEILTTIANKTNKTVTFDKTALVNGSDTLIPKVVFGGISVPTEQISRLNITYTTTGNGINADPDSKIISANGTGSATVQATLSIPGLDPIETPETTILSHELVHHDAIAAECDADGYKEYWSCSGCPNVYYADANAQSTYESITVSAPGHNYEEADRIDATYTSEGLITRACTRCYEEEYETIPTVGYKYEEGTVTLSGGNNFKLVALEALGGATEYAQPGGYGSVISNTDWAYGFDSIRCNVQKGTGVPTTNNITSFFRISIAIDFTQNTSTTFEFGMNYNYGEFIIGGKTVKIPNQNAWNSFTIMGDGSVYLNGEQVEGAKMTGNSIVFELDTNRPDAYYGAFTIKKAVSYTKETREYTIGTQDVTGTPIDAIGGNTLTAWTAIDEGTRLEKPVLQQSIQNYNNGGTKAEARYFRYTFELDWTQFGSLTIPITTNVVNGTVDVYIDGVKASIDTKDIWYYITVKQDGTVYFNGTLMEGAKIEGDIVIELDTNRPSGAFYGNLYIGMPTFTLIEPVITGPKWETLEGVDLGVNGNGTKTDGTVGQAEKDLGITSVTEFTFAAWQNTKLATLDLSEYKMVRFYVYRAKSGGGGSIYDGNDGGNGLVMLNIDSRYDRWVEIILVKSAYGDGFNLYVDGERQMFTLKNNASLTNLNMLAFNGSSGVLKYSDVSVVPGDPATWEALGNYDLGSGMGGTKTPVTPTDTEAALGITSVTEYKFAGWQHTAFASLDLTKYESVKFYMYRPSTNGVGSIYDQGDGGSTGAIVYLNDADKIDSWVEIELRKGASGYDMYVNGTKKTFTLKSGLPLTNLNQLALNGNSTTATVKYSNVQVVNLPAEKWDALDVDLASGMAGTRTDVTLTDAEKALGITFVKEYKFAGWQNAAFANLDLTKYESVKFYMSRPSTNGAGSIYETANGGNAIVYLNGTGMLDTWVEIELRRGTSGYDIYVNGAKATFTLKDGAALTNLNQLAINGNSTTATLKYSNIMVPHTPTQEYKTSDVDLTAGMSGTRTDVALTDAEKALGITFVKQYTITAWQNAGFASLDLTKYESVKFYMSRPSTNGGGSIYETANGSNAIVYLNGDKLDTWVEIELRKGTSGYDIYVNGSKVTFTLKDGAALTNLNQLAINGSSGSLKYSDIKVTIAGYYVEPEIDFGGEEEVVEKDYTIVYESGNSEIAYASQELQKYFKEATGNRLSKSTYKGTASANGKVIVLGVLPASDKGFSFEGLGESDYVIKKDGDVIYIYGKTGYGVINGVYALLGQLFDLEIFYEDTYTLTKNEGFKITADAVTEVTSSLTFDYIWSGLGELRPTESNDFDESYAYQMGFVTDYKVNYNNVHNATTLLEEYRTTNPGWFYSESGAAYGQIYLAAENFAIGEGTLVTTVAGKIFDLMKKDTAYEREIALLFSAMDEDIWPHGTGYANSDALYNKYGTYAAENIIFMNAVAAELDRMMSEESLGRTIQLQLLCYNKTLVAPDLNKSGLTQADKDAVKMYKGTNISVVPLIAPVEGNRHLSFEDSRNKVKNPATGEIDSGSKTIAQVIEGWEALANGNDMHMWWYASDGNDFFTMMDTITNMQANYQFAAAHGITVMFNQSQGNNAVAPDWSRLKIYVQSQLQKDVNADVDALIDEWMDVYFGAGAESMKTLLAAQKTWYGKFFDAAFEENVGHKTAGGFTGSDDMAKWHFAETPKKPTFSFLDSTKNTMLVNWMGYIDAAKAAINADASLTAEQKTALCNRVDLESLTIRYTLIEIFGTKTYDSSTSAFYQYAKSLGVTHYKENGGAIN